MLLVSSAAEAHAVVISSSLTVALRSKWIFESLCEDRSGDIYTLITAMQF